MQESLGAANGPLRLGITAGPVIVVFGRLLRVSNVTI